ncbi:uncharacterized protein LOC141602222 [Silene latifolia]|uniref:uncharacterized protein LOC141602222 n=1 Tax=Silene latifolia TaxID=37657 RepID=UPI003D76DEE7
MAYEDAQVSIAQSFSTVTHSINCSPTAPRRQVAAFIIDPSHFSTVFHLGNISWKKKKLLEACLKYLLLPAYLAAAFTKKLSKLSLQVPPSGALVIIALVHNRLRRYPSINCLVHQVHGQPLFCR